MHEPRIKYLYAVLFFLLLSLTAHGLSGQEGIIEIELWTEISEILPSLDNSKTPYLTDGDIFRRVLTDAAWIVSGMIYGFDVVYTPLDLQREVNELLEISPVASILWGDKNLEITDSWAAKEKFYIQVRYFLNSAQITRLKHWESNLFPDAEGSGRVPLFLGHQGRIESIKEGIKGALRNYLRSRVTNKPREIRCRVLLSESPYTILDAGGYTSHVKVTIKLDEVIPYGYY